MMCNYLWSLNKLLTNVLEMVFYLMEWKNCHLQT